MRLRCSLTVQILQVSICWMCLKKSLIYGGPTLQLTGLKESVTDGLVPPQHTIRGLVDSMPQWVLVGGHKVTHQISTHDQCTNIVIFNT